MHLWIDAVLSILLAPECAACASPLDHPTRGAVCGRCWSAVLPLTSPFCDRCGDSLPTAHKAAGLCTRCLGSGAIGVERARSVGIYDGSLRAIIHAFKYDGRRSLARPLAALMRERGREILNSSDIAVPVPLHRSRRRQRGFNQAEDLAKHLGLPVVHALARVRRTAVQADLPAPRRHANVNGAFVPTRAAGCLSGRAVVLIDDVSTTGATLHACAEALRAQNVGALFALTAARAVTKLR